MDGSWQHTQWANGDRPVEPAQPAGATAPQAKVIHAETVATLRRVLAQAERGEITGFVLAAVSADRRYLFEVSGEAARHPMLGLGLVGSLWAEMMARMRGWS